VIDAQEALRIGLVEEVVPAAALMGRAETLAMEIAANAPLAVAETLHAVDEGIGLPLELALLREAARFSAISSTADKAEGARAFLDKRPPAWKGE
jgi:enoyl-CoA hydratase